MKRPYMRFSIVELLLLLVLAGSIYENAMLAGQKRELQNEGSELEFENYVLKQERQRLLDIDPDESKLTLQFNSDCGCE